MWTIFYQGAFIHGYCAETNCRVDGRAFRTLLGAKRFITARRNG
jgi:hypothetical protein